MKKTGRTTVASRSASPRYCSIPLGVEVDDAGVALGTADRTVDELLDARLDGGVDGVSTVLDLGLVAVLPEVGHAEDPLDGLHRRREPLAVRQVALDDRRAPLCERRRRVPVGTAGECVDPDAVLEEVVYDCAALRAGRANDQDRIYHHQLDARRRHNRTVSRGSARCESRQRVP
jgi:hypothetical protein